MNNNLNNNSQNNTKDNSTTNSNDIWGFRSNSNNDMTNTSSIPTVNPVFNNTNNTPPIANPNQVNSPNNTTSNVSQIPVFSPIPNPTAGPTSTSSNNNIPSNNQIIPPNNAILNNPPIPPINPTPNPINNPVIPPLVNNNNVGQNNNIPPINPNNTTTSNPTPTNNDDELLKAFIGKNYEKITTAPFNIPGFFFTSLYMFYRKMFLYGFLVFLGSQGVNNFTDNLIVNISFNVAIGFFVNKIYLDYANKKINQIKLTNYGKSDDELKLICANKGGTSVGKMLLGLLLELSAVIIILIILVTLGFGLLGFADFLRN